MGALMFHVTCTAADAETLNNGPLGYGGGGGGGVGGLVIATAGELNT